MDLTFEQAIIFLPLITAIITFFLTSLFTLYRENKKRNIHSRIFFEYSEFSFRYPFSNIPVHGEGKVLLGKNGRKLDNHARKDEGLVYSFLILKNITENNAVNIKIRNRVSNRVFKSQPSNIIEEEFFMPVWKWEDTLYIPVTIYDADSIFSTNEALSITYNTETFEKFEYTSFRGKNGTYNDKLKKRYFGFIWITKINYQKSEFYSFSEVRNDENQMN